MYIASRRRLCKGLRNDVLISFHSYSSSENSIAQFKVRLLSLRCYYLTDQPGAGMQGSMVRHCKECWNPLMR